MAEKRKLLGEIEKCYKKVEEGFEIFDDIMTKMNEANSENQREKFQDDLKKEIKKLQRLRDQIKGWQNSSDIKDKDSLIKFRKLIENRMELFKEIERENKTKPHSKQGLSIEDKLDPKEKEKFDTIEWLNTQIRRIQDEIDVTESKLEILTSSDGGRKRGGKKDDSKKNEKEVEELKKHLERVKYHSNNLEVCLRLITNEKLQAKDTMNRLKEPLEMYIDALDPENDEDPESYDPEDIYEELHLPMYISQLTCMTLGSIDDEKCQANDINKTPCGSPTSGGDHLQRHQSGDGSTGPQKSASAISASIPIAPLKLTRLGSSQVSSEHSSLVSPLPQTPPTLPGIPYNSIVAGKKLSSTTPEEIHVNNAKDTINRLKEPLERKKLSSTTPEEIHVNNVKDTINRLKEPLEIEMYVDALEPENDEDPDPEGSMDDEKCQANDINKTPCGSPTSGGDHLQRHQSDDGSTGPQKSASAISTNIPIAPLKLTRLGSSQVSSEHSSLVSPLPQTPPLPGIPYNFAGKKLSSTTPEEIHMNNVDVQVLNTSKMDEFNNQLLALQGTYPLGCNGSCLGPNITDKKTIIPPLLGASPLGPVPIQGELEVQLNIVEAAISKVPLQMDSERQRAYLPKMPCQTPAYYPQVPLASVDSLDYYLRLSVETLFFIFYYMEGSRAQLLAAKALKKLSWRFHTKYLMWFQRHEEPKQITDDYEQGTYVYFDFEKWTQRKKEQFMFEYKYLEDKELPD